MQLLIFFNCFFFKLSTEMIGSLKIFYQVELIRILEIIHLTKYSNEIPITFCYTGMEWQCSIVFFKRLLLALNDFAHILPMMYS